MVTARNLHRWDLPAPEATVLQQELAGQIRLERAVGSPRLIAGVDVAYAKDSDELVAGAVVIDLESLDVVDQAVVAQQAAYPYVPGLFSFREAPPILAVLERLSIEPDLIACDGHGYAHPQRFGLASHIGLLCEIPTIGCAKTHLIGTHDPVGPHRGDQTPLRDRDETIGAVLRTQTNIKPVFVSPGHLTDFEQSYELILQLAPEFRLPETTRQSDQLVSTELRIRAG